MTRYIAHLGASGKGVCSRKGIVAGDTFATSLAKAHIFEMAENVCWSRRWLDIYLDDLTISKQGSHRQAIEEMGKSARLLTQGVRQELGGEVAADKNGTSSDEQATDPGPCEEDARCTHARERWTLHVVGGRT